MVAGGDGGGAGAEMSAWNKGRAGTYGRLCPGALLHLGREVGALKHLRLLWRVRGGERDPGEGEAEAGRSVGRRAEGSEGERGGEAAGGGASGGVRRSASAKGRGRG